MMMKFSLKHGLGLLAGLFLSAAALASEPVPIEDRDAFEKQFIDCIMASAKNNCLVTLFTPHLDQHFINLTGNAEETIKSLNQFYLNKVSLSSTDQVHHIRKKMIAEIFDSRSYLIEQGNGTLVGVRLNFRFRKGKWYVFNMEVSTDPDFVLKLVDLP